MQIKKTGRIVENLTESEQKRGQLIQQIQVLYQEGVSICEIARITGKERKTIRKYTQGDPQILCQNKRHRAPDKYRNFVIEWIQQGITQSRIAEQLQKMGYDKAKGTARRYICRVAQECGLALAKYSNQPLSDKKIGTTKPCVYITRKRIFNYLWMNKELSKECRTYLWETYPVLAELSACIRQFRELFRKKSMGLLYLFIENYRNSKKKELAGFASGLNKDILAVENAVASDLSNGFVEGTNSKLKMIKRTMYGRCSQRLLAAKLMYHPNSEY